MAAFESSFLFQSPGDGPVTAARLHPVVLFNICDSFIRRNEETKRVIGTLLGTTGPDGVLEIKNSYTVPHNESSGQVAVDIEYHRTMAQLNLTVNPKEVIVGWYSTGSQLLASDALLHAFYRKEAPNAVLLSVDTGFASGAASLRAYRASQLSLGDRELGEKFSEIPLDLRMLEAEQFGFASLTKTISEKLPNDLEATENTVLRLQGLIDTALAYVDDVVEGRREPDNEVGRTLMEAVGAVPRLSPDAFGKLFNNSVQDVLLVLYLANLTRAQLAVAAKLNSAAQQL